MSAIAMLIQKTKSQQGNLVSQITQISQIMPFPLVARRAMKHVAQGAALGDVLLGTLDR
jgi:hypothetical protein